MCGNVNQCCTYQSWLRLGTLVVGVLCMVLGTTGLILASFGGTHLLPYYTGKKWMLFIFLIMIIMSVNMIVCSVLLLVAATKNHNKKLLMPWLVVGASTFAIGISIIYILLNLVPYIGPSSIVAISFWVVVYSYYHQLEKTEEESKFIQFIC